LRIARHTHNDESREWRAEKDTIHLSKEEGSTLHTSGSSFSLSSLCFVKKKHKEKKKKTMSEKNASHSFHLGGAQAEPQPLVLRGVLGCVRIPQLSMLLGVCVDLFSLYMKTADGAFLFFLSHHHFFFPPLFSFPSLVKKQQQRFPFSATCQEK